MLIEIKNVSKSFKKQQVLRNINLSIYENEIFGFIGPSGAGKTTLIRLIMGAASSDSGLIRVMDYKVPNLTVLSNIGYMPQSDALYNDLSGYDNLIFFGGMYHMGRTELKKRADEVLNLVELNQDAKKKVINYSGGMKKRLSLAIALLHSPRLLILDEPTVGIDPILRKKIWDEFYRQKEQGKTILVTTHVMDEAVKCDRLGLIYHGSILDCDTVEALLGRTKNNSIEELFLENGGKTE
jgi:ABC-2 type transport system ATP-binding protein